VLHCKVYHGLAEIMLCDSEGVLTKICAEGKENALRRVVGVARALGDVQAATQGHQPPDVLLQLAELPCGPNFMHRLFTYTSKHAWSKGG
jgi:hypothetical protein